MIGLIDFLIKFTKSHCLMWYGGSESTDTVAAIKDSRLEIQIFVMAAWCIYDCIISLLLLYWGLEMFLQLIAWICKKPGLVCHWFWKCARRSCHNFRTKGWWIQSFHVGFQLSSFVQGQLQISLYKNDACLAHTGNSLPPWCAPCSTQQYCFKLHVKYWILHYVD